MHSSAPFLLHYNSFQSSSLNSFTVMFTKTALATLQSVQKSSGVLCDVSGQFFFTRQGLNHIGRAHFKALS